LLKISDLHYRVILTTVTSIKGSAMTFVNWPVDNEAYRDSGEGGLFAYAVWPESKMACFVDVHPQMPAPDVLVDASGPLATDFRSQRSNVNDSDYSDSDESYSAKEFDLQISTGAVVFLGSTGASLFREHGGSYFHVTSEALTDVGRTVIETLTAAYGSEPTFVTYLDT
jgi:hypothetical protein